MTILIKNCFMIICIFSENSKDLVRIKQKILADVPQHSLKSNPNLQTFDVDKIVSSDDLINILEDHYQNGAKNTRECEIYHDQPIDFNKYLKSIASITYHESYENYINCVVLD